VRRYHAPEGTPIVPHPYKPHPRKKGDSFGGMGESGGLGRTGKRPQGSGPLDIPSSSSSASSAGTLARGILADAAQVEPTISPILQDAAKANGGRLDGFDHRLKEEASLTRKIREKSVQKGLTEEQYASQIGDALRYTIVFPDANMTEGVTSTMDALGKQYQIKDFENSFLPDNTYKGMAMTLVDSATNLSVELQLHTESSIAAKGPSHELFKVIRDPTTPVEKSLQLRGQLADMWQGVAEPAGLSDLGAKPMIRKRRRRTSTYGVQFAESASDQHKDPTHSGVYLLQ
jgi:hypothetical protein